MVFFLDSSQCWPAQLSQPKQVHCELPNNLITCVPSSGPSLKHKEGMKFKDIALGLDPLLKNLQKVKLFYLSRHDIL